MVRLNLKELWRKKFIIRINPIFSSNRLIYYHEKAESTFRNSLEIMIISKMLRNTLVHLTACFELKVFGYIRCLSGSGIAPSAVSGGQGVQFNLKVAI